MSQGDLDAYFRSRKAPGPLDVKVGDKVMYTRYFLLSIRVSATDDSWRDQGEVIEVGNHDLATVRWADGTVMKTKTNNLCYPGPNLRHCE